MDTVERLRGKPMVMTENGYTSISVMGGANMIEWKPIETAPMDTDVLLFEPDYSIFVGSNFSLDDGDSYWCACGGPRRKPTHWMPLPEPPK